MKRGPVSRWTAADIATLNAMTGATEDEAAARLGRTPMGIRTKRTALARDIRSADRAAKLAAEHPPRPCLMCRRKFQPDGRFNKVCTNCKSGSTWLSGYTTSGFKGSRT